MILKALDMGYKNVYDEVHHYCAWFRSYSPLFKKTNITYPKKSLDWSREK
jgi:hypothetical protein